MTGAASAQNACVFVANRIPRCCLRCGIVVGDGGDVGGADSVDDTEGFVADVDAAWSRGAGVGGIKEKRCAICV